jgi:hypothetical protein
MSNDAKYSRAYRLRHPERRAASVKAYYERNRDRIRAYQREHYQRETVKARSRAYHLRRTYGITIEEFEAMKSLGCPCGNATWDDTPRTALSPVVDHDRATGRVRGVIHHICNRALGVLGDNADGLETWLRYLNSR